MRAVPSPGQTWPASSSGQAVSGAELSRDGRNDTVLGALRRARPEFFNARGSTPPLVSIDDGPLADLSILETMRVSAIEDVKLERAVSSVGHARVTTSGSVIVGDVLVVRTRRVTTHP